MKILLTLLILHGAAAQTFEVASIKPTTAEPGSSSGITTKVGRMSAHNVTLRGCIKSAYGVPESRVFGGPKWVDEERYDIDAKAPGPAGDHEMMTMLQALLAERFQLVVHRETRTVAGYSLMVGKRGILAKASRPDVGSTSNSTRRSIEAVGCDMACVARKLSEVLHVPVSNATAIEGRYDFKLEFTPEELTAKTPPADASGPTVFAAVEQQLGLRLEPQKLPAEAIVIDRAEKASGN